MGTIHFHPSVGQVLYCDFAGLKYGEMDKRRPVVVLSPKYAQAEDRCLVVGLSTTAPPTIRNFHCLLETNPIPDDDPATKVWVKGDMLMTVAFERLFGWWDRRVEGKRDYKKLVVSSNDLTKIRKCVLLGMGLGSLTAHL